MHRPRFAATGLLEPAPSGHVLLSKNAFGRGYMSIGAEVAAHLPFLRRYARALTGSQSTGDAFVRAALEAALADEELAETLRGGRVPLYRLFNTLWASAHIEVVGEDPGQGLHESAAQGQLR